MCTAMTLKTAQGECLFGRTMDFSYALDPQLYIMPVNYRWNNAMDTEVFQNRYSFMGIGQEIPRITFADEINEAAFSYCKLSGSVIN